MWSAALERRVHRKIGMLVMLKTHIVTHEGRIVNLNVGLECHVRLLTKIN